MVTPRGLPSFFPAGAQDSPINKLLYARDIPRYKRMVERYEGEAMSLEGGWVDRWLDVYGCSPGAGPAGVRLVYPAVAVRTVSDRYYADIRQTVPASDQEMNSILAELSRVWPSLCFLGWAQVSCHEGPALLQGSPGDLSNLVSWLGQDTYHHHKCRMFQMATRKDQGSQHLTTEQQGLVRAAAS